MQGTSVHLKQKPPTRNGFRWANAHGVLSVCRMFLVAYQIADGEEKNDDEYAGGIEESHDFLQAIRGKST